MTWWNVDYPFRRNLRIIAPPVSVPTGHPATVILDVAKTIGLNKVLPDFDDLIVVYNNVVLPRSVTQTGPNLIVNFDLYSDLTTDDYNYHIYYGNPSTLLSHAPYTRSDWPVTVNYDDIGVSYTHPGEDWVDGIASKKHAKAIFAFYGVKVRLISNTGPDQGFAELQLDNGSWESIDLFSDTTESNVIVYEKDGLSSDYHSLRIKALGLKNAGATGSRINIVRFDYMKNVEIIDQGEEVTDLTWSSSLGGA